MKPLFAMLLLAQVVANTPRGIVVAHDGRIDLPNGTSVEGVRDPRAIVAGDDRVAVLDPLHDEAVIVANGVATRVRTGATPLDGVFIGRDLFVIERDAQAIERVNGTSLPLAADPAFIRERNGRLYVYSRSAGVLQEITTSPFAIARTTRIAPFASAMELDDHDAYFVYPREAKLRLVALATMRTDGEIKVGAVPVDVALTGRTLAIADPSAKRVWVIEGKESFAHAFVRGFFGLSRLGNRDSQFPTGIDRVFISGKSWVAYDSSSGTLYRFDRQKSSVIAQHVAPKAFTVTPNGVFAWDETVRRLQRIGVDE
jgi:hypothetical protein